MALRLRDIVLPGPANARPQTIIDVTRDTRGDSHDQRAGRHLHAFGDDGARRDHAARSDAHVVEQDAPHPDETLVFHNAGVQDDAVAYADSRTDQRGLALVHVHDGGVLEVRILAEHDGARRDEGGRMDYWRTGWNGHCTHASVGSPFF